METTKGGNAVDQEFYELIQTRTFLQMTIDILLSISFVIIATSGYFSPYIIKYKSEAVMYFFSLSIYTLLILCLLCVRKKFPINVVILCFIAPFAGFNLGFLLCLKMKDLNNVILNHG
jgi:hypothetical protein